MIILDRFLEHFVLIFQFLFNTIYKHTHKSAENISKILTGLFGLDHGNFITYPCFIVIVVYLIITPLTFQAGIKSHLFSLICHFWKTLPVRCDKTILLVRFGPYFQDSPADMPWIAICASLTTAIAQSLKIIFINSYFLENSKTFTKCFLKLTEAYPQTRKFC